MRTGLITRKIGMSVVYSKEGLVVPVTLLKLSDCEVVSIKNKEKNGYDAVEIGFENAKLKNVTKPLKGHFAKNKVTPKKITKEFRVAEDAVMPVGTKLLVQHFVEGQFVDAQATSIGKGFAGAMKRWNFGGMRASHGVSISHRAHGSTGQNQDPGKVAKGKKMAGHMGDKQITVQNLKVVLIDEEEQLIAVKGAIPGSKNSYVVLKDAIKKSLPANAPYPTFANVTKEEVKDLPLENDVNVQGEANES
jgi:large subunit ribosomal protein L3